MSFYSLFVLVRKDLKMFFRSKVASLVIILIPLLIVMFAGYSFNSSGFSNVQVGVFSDSYTDFTNQIISDFGRDGFTHHKYSSFESCADSVKNSESQICIVFPSGLTPDVSSEEIVFYADYSRINLVYNLVDKIEGNVMVRTSNVSEGMAQGLIDSLEKIKVDLPNAKSQVDETVTDLSNNRNLVSGLVFPVSEVNSIISELEDVKGDSNDTAIIKDVENVIVLLENLKVKANDVSSKLNTVLENEDEVSLKLSSVSSSLNNVILFLNSGRSLSAENVVSPIKMKIESISVDSNNKDYLIPMMFSLIALFGAILLSSTFVLKARKSRAFFRNFMTPAKDIWFILSIYLVCLIILFIQFLLVFIGVEYILKMDILPILLPLSGVLFLSLSTFVVIGMFIGYLFRSDETTIFASMIIAALFMFFSNVLLPIENASGGISKLLKFNPLVLSNLAFKKIVLFRLGFESVLNEILILSGFFVVFFILSYAFRRLTRKML